MSFPLIPQELPELQLLAHPGGRDALVVSWQSKRYGRAVWLSVPGSRIPTLQLQTDTSTPEDALIGAALFAERGALDASLMGRHKFQLWPDYDGASLASARVTDWPPY